MPKKPHLTGTNKAKSRLNAILGKVKKFTPLDKISKIRPLTRFILYPAFFMFIAYYANIGGNLPNAPHYDDWQKSSHGQMLSNADKNFAHASPSTDITYIDVESIFAKGLNSSEAADYIVKQLETSHPAIFSTLTRPMRKLHANMLANMIEDLDHPFQMGHKYPSLNKGMRYNSLTTNPDSHIGTAQKWRDNILHKTAIIVMSSGTRTTSQLMLHNLGRIYDSRYVLQSPPDFDQMHDNIIIHETAHGLDFFSAFGDYNILHGESFADALAILYLADKYGPDAAFLEQDYNVRIFSALTRRADHYTAPTVRRMIDEVQHLSKNGKLAKMSLDERAKFALKITHETIIPEESFNLLEKIEADFKTRFASPNEGTDLKVAKYFLKDASPEKAQEISNYYLSIAEYAADPHINNFLKTYPKSMANLFKKSSPAEATALYEKELRALIAKRGYNENMRKMIFTKAEKFAQKLDMSTDLRGDKSPNPYRKAIENIKADYKTPVKINPPQKAPKKQKNI